MIKQDEIKYHIPLKGFLSSLIIVSLLFGCGEKEVDVEIENNSESLFKLIRSEITGIDFINHIPENDTLSQFTYHYLFNGNGVGIGDINNDGLNDIYISGNSTSSKLYLNQGDFKFQDITDEAGVVTNQWMTGVSMIDVNNDGWLDIYVGSSGPSKKPSQKRNKLFINNKDNTFTESANMWGVDDAGNTSTAAFFDFDNDGDLDMYLGNHALEYYSDINVPYRRTMKMNETSAQRFYENKGDRFIEITKKVGMEAMGYCLSATPGDYNNDGLIDLYVCNDYHIPDFLYINKGNGTFKDECYSRVKHSSINSMGSDIADVNNDGILDFITLDMLPENPDRLGRLLGPQDYDYIRVSNKNGYGQQYMKNNLQMGIGNGLFSEQGYLYNVARTDWSWSPLFCDFDSDGKQDLFVSNGYYRDVTDLDFIMYQNRKEQVDKQSINLEDVLKMLPFEKIKNYLYIQGKEGFVNKADNEGLSQATLSTGAAIGDLDGDGKVDLIVCNQGSPTLVYKNQQEGNNYINIKLKYKSHKTTEGYKIWVDNKEGGYRLFQSFSNRGYLSSSEPIVHIGLQEETATPKVFIQDNRGAFYETDELKLNTTNVIYIDGLKRVKTENHPKTSNQNLYFSQDNNVINIRHREQETPDFKREPLLPHRFTMLGPGMSTGDVNQDGIEDVFLGMGASSGGAELLFGSTDGRFRKSNSQPWKSMKADITGSCLFDADGDGDLDLYIALGGAEFSWPNDKYKHRFYLNNGTGIFTESSSNIPNIITSSSSVSSADYDGDGDLDLFISGRVFPGSYPTIQIRSYLLKNNGGIFVDATSEDAPDLTMPGMICEGIFTDYNNDGNPDLMLVGEFTPIIFMKNVDGKFIFSSRETQTFGISGWFNSICPLDIDNDGDMDYVVSNKGYNSFMKATQTKPIKVFWSDFDNNGRQDFVLSYTQNGRDYPVNSLEEMAMVMPSYLSKKYKNYSSFSGQTVQDIFGDKLKDNQMFANEFGHVLLINQGGMFSIQTLPRESQISPITGMKALDVNQDGYLDIVGQGNNRYTRVQHGPDDAHNGFVLLNKNGAGFQYINGNSSGLYVPGDGRSMVCVTSAKGTPQILSSQNNDKLLAFRLKNTSRSLNIPKNAKYATATLKNGQQRNVMQYLGGGYMSSSTPKVWYDKNVQKITFWGNDRQKPLKEVKIDF